MSETSPRPLRVAAVVTAASALAIYVATLAPGLIAITDTPKFQFIGRILGTAHPPGYPLFVIVSYFFGFLPVGSLAYRINLMSAVFGAATCGLTFVCARLLGARPLIASAAALGFAFGSTFWYVSTIAEVYALNAFLVSAALAALLAWERSRRPAWFFAGVAFVGVAMGNHTTVVFMVPAIACFACLESPRFALRPRTIGVAALIVALALTQYLFIVVRTYQGAWGEAPASNLRELAGVVAGAEYFGDVMPGGIRQLLDERLPIVWRAFVREMSLPVVALSVFGAVAIWQRSKPLLALFVVVVSSYSGFAAAYMPHEFEVFLVPAFLVSWLLAATAAEGIASAADIHAGRLASSLTAAALVAVPIWQLAHNYAMRDLSHARADLRFFDALFARLADRSMILHEDFLVARMVHYKTLGERAGQGRQLLANVAPQADVVATAWRDRYQVLAFPQTAKMMRLLDAAEFSYSPLDLSGGTLARYLDDLPRGSIVAVSSPAAHLESAAAGGLLPFDRIGFASRVPAGHALALVGRTGSRTSTSQSAPANAQIRLGGDPAARRPPIEARVDGDVATVLVGGREIVRTRAGMAVVVWDRTGLSSAFVVPASQPLTPTLPTPYAVYQLRAMHEWRSIGLDPIDLTSEIATGHFVYKIPPGRSRFVLYAGRERPLAPALLESSARGWPGFDVKAFDGPHAADGPLSQALVEDAMPRDRRLMASKRVHRIAIDADWPATAGVHVGLGAPPDIAIGRLTAGAPALIYGLDLKTHLSPIDPHTFSLHMARDHHEHLIGAGWSPVQADGVGPYRETVAPEAELQLPIPFPGRLRLGVQLVRLPGAGTSATIGLLVNGQRLEPVTVGNEWRRYWWDVPPEATARDPGSLVLTVSPTGQRIAVSDVLIETVD